MASASGRSVATGRGGDGGDYEYFFCIRRHRKTANCDLPYISALDIEDAVDRQWAQINFTEDEIATFSESAREELHRSAESNSRLLADQKRRLAQLQQQKDRLIDAYMAGALPVEDLKIRQTRLSTEIADAQRLLHNAQEANAAVLDRLEAVLALLRRAKALYSACGPEGRQLLNSAVFTLFKVDIEDPDGDHAPHICGAPLDPVVHAVVTAGSRNERTPDDVSLVEGSNVTHLAEVEGFEPSMGL